MTFEQVVLWIFLGAMLGVLIQIRAIGEIIAEILDEEGEDPRYNIQHPDYEIEIPDEE